MISRLKRWPDFSQHIFVLCKEIMPKTILPNSILRLEYFRKNEWKSDGNNCRWKAIVIIMRSLSGLIAVKITFKSQFAWQSIWHLFTIFLGGIVVDLWSLGLCRALCEPGGYIIVAVWRCICNHNNNNNYNKLCLSLQIIICVIVIYAS